MIPENCPNCGAIKEWKENVNPFTTGIPIGKLLRISIGVTGTVRFHKYKYYCEKCGFKAEYDDREISQQKYAGKHKGQRTRFFGKWM